MWKQNYAITQYQCHVKGCLTYGPEVGLSAGNAYKTAHYSDGYIYIYTNMLNKKKLKEHQYPSNNFYLQS